MLPYRWGIIAWKLSNRDTTMRGKRVGVAPEIDLSRSRMSRRGASCRVAFLISSPAFARENCNWLYSRTGRIPGARSVGGADEGPIDRKREPIGWHTRERDYARETTGRHDSGHHSIESYIRLAFIRDLGQCLIN